MAPMTGGVADGEEDGLALGAGFRERLFAPGVPVHRIVRVLQKIRRLLMREAVCMLAYFCSVDLWALRIRRYQRLGGDPFRLRERLRLPLRKRH